MNRILVILLTLLVSLSATSAFAQSRAEKLEYEVTWGYAEVAQMKLQQGCPRDGYVPAALRAKSLGAANQVHAFEVRLDSFSTPTFVPMEGRTYIYEDDRPRSFRTRFRQDTGAAEVSKSFRKKITNLKLKLKPPTHDLLSWTYHLRQRPLVSGATFDYFVWDGWKLGQIRATVGDTEKVVTPAGTYEAFRVSLTRTRLHHAGPKRYTALRRVEKLATMWLHAEGSHIPVALDFEAPVGTAKVRLKRSYFKPCK